MNHQLKVSLVMSMIFTGCTATFEPRLNSYDLSKSRLPTAKEVQAGVEVSVEEYVSANKSLKAFDADVAQKGVLPLLIRLENKGAEDCKIQRSRVRAFLDGQPLSQMYGIEAAQLGAKRDGTWNALVNTAAIGPLAIYFWPATMAGSFSQAKTINRKIEQHFESLELADTAVKPGDTAAGFVFFKMPDYRNKLDKVTVELTLETEEFEESGGKRLRYKFSLPTLEIGGPGSASTISEGDH